MKLAKVSLAAVVALGALSTASMAKDLSEAIKGVDVSGYLRYRYENRNVENDDYVDGIDGNTRDRHEWKAVANFTIPTSETFSAVVGVEYNDRTNTGSSGDANLDDPAIGDRTTDLGNGKTIDGDDVVYRWRDNKLLLDGKTIDGDDEQGFAVRQFYGVWTPNGTKTTVQLGKFNLATPVTDPGYDRGTGILALNSDLEYVTFALAAIDTWHVDDLLNVLGKQVTNDRQNNIYAAAAIAGYEGFSGQLWFLNIEEMVSSLVFAELGYKYDMFGIEGQYFNNKLDTTSDANDITNYEKGYLFHDNLWEDSYQVYTIQATVDWSILSAKAGYMGSDKGYFVQLTDEATGVNYGGEILLSDYSANGLADKNGKNELEGWWIAAMVDTTWNNLSVGGDYVQSTKTYNSGTAGAKDYDTDGTEWTARVEWKPTSQWKIKSYYSEAETESDAAKALLTTAYQDEKNNRLRVEAKYSF